jgi:hypothetical protein
MARSIIARILRAGAAAWCCAASLAAFAGSGTLAAQVTPLQDSVTYARAGLAPVIGYLVSVNNAGGNTINDIHFIATLEGPWQGSGGRFDSAEGVACTASADGRSIDCAAGQLKAGQAAPTFALFFRARERATPGTPVCAGSECAQLRAALLYAEGNGGLLNSTPQNSQLTLPPVNVALGTATPTLVRSAVTKAGGLLFTGDQAVATSGDLFTASVKVPAAPTYTTGAIAEQAFAGCSNFVSCAGADIQVPGEFTPYLTITLRQDVLNIRPGTKIGSVVIQYTPTAVAGQPAPQPLILGACPGPGQPLSDRPCIDSARTYSKQDKPPPGFEGDFEWTIISRKNGSYKVF